MTESKIEVGTIVRHPARPDWGPGKALIIGGGGKVTVYFRDIEEKKIGDAVKTLATMVVPLEIAAEQNDSMLDSLPAFTKGKFVGLKKPRLSLDHAVQKFIDSQSDAFDGPVYVEKMRSPMEEAHKMWVKLLGGDQGSALLDEGKIKEARRHLLKIGAKGGLLTPDEKKTFEGALGDDDAAEPFLRALFDVVSLGAPDQESFQRLIDAGEQLPEQDEGTQALTWTMLTQYPFIASPEHHIQFKPALVQKCAARLNFDLRFTAALNWWTYERILQMARILLDKVEPSGAKDFIDVQSMIRVIAAA